MATRKSAGILMYRERSGQIEILLVHPGGPFWAKKDDGAWSIPKGEYDENEDPLDAARREFEEETGFRPEGQFVPLSPIKQPGGKVVTAWVAVGDFDASAIRSNTFALEWPRGSGRFREYPEVDRAGWFSMAEARQKILKGQVALLDQLEQVVRT